MQNATLQTISTARAILEMDIFATDEDQYCAALCALNDLRFGISDMATAVVVAELARNVSAHWDKAVKHVTADEVRVAIDVVDEVKSVIARAARH